MSRKKVAILGITGSIGESAIQIIRSHKDLFEIVLASAHSQSDKLSKLAHEFNIPYVVLTQDQTKHIQLPEKSKIYYGKQELQHLLETIDYDIALNAISGSAGLQSSITTLLKGADLALANKESLVMSGHLVEDIMQRSSSRILPVDSEHSAVFQCIGNHKQDEIRAIHLTASGGPFRSLPLHKFHEITLQETMNHPTWNMGSKVTVDSATMMNKGLEVIEAHWLFHVGYDHIDAVIHPQSIIHSMVEFRDGSILAQMSVPSMQLPILYALSYPGRIPSLNVQTDILKLGNLNFEPIDRERYPLFYLACEVGRKGGLLPTIMNAANEAAVHLFLDEIIHYRQIYEIVDQAVSAANNMEHPNLETILNTNTEVYTRIMEQYH
ncbi:MAG TPA: 1-deoxy-D-xylulose-5-phosphate reductoisomerase [Candidatus Cloacimonadota bacterium]|nr:1-deoxy-D-xylulose-5-phosphate reductoisomerase [Candidatus Cloacimonadota bacterium]HPT72322.1 1-deoxy-D-xylulose-5-phosphate reductoisomerase [Candidatus Cloacimonadota bacterium]